jgi:hypothetical protein
MLVAETAGYWLSDLLLRVTGLSDAVLQNDDRVFRIANTLPPLLFVTVAGGPRSLRGGAVLPAAPRRDH